MALLAGGVIGGSKLKQLVRQAQKEQQQLCAGLVEESKNGKAKRPKVAVDKVFFRRLLKILRM